MSNTGEFQRAPSGATDARESGLAREESRHRGVQYALRRAVLWDRVAVAHLGRTIHVDLYLGFALLRERMRNQRPARTIAKDLVGCVPPQAEWFHVVPERDGQKSRAYTSHYM